MKITKITKEFIKFAAKEKYLEKEVGGWCVRCALGNAKSDFDDKYEEFKMPIGELLNQFGTGFKITDYDKLLIEARDYLALKNFEMLFKTKKEAINFMLSYERRIYENL